MKTSSILDTYQTWLTHREYSPATIQKYTKSTLYRPCRS